MFKPMVRTLPRHLLHCCDEMKTQLSGLPNTNAFVGGDPQSIIGSQIIGLGKGIHVRDNLIATEFCGGVRVNAQELFGEFATDSGPPAACPRSEEALSCR